MGPLLSRIYKKFFWNTYDHIGKLIILNAIWFAACPTLTYLCFRYIPLAGYTRVGVTIAVALLTHSFFGSSIFGMTASITARRDPHLRQALTYARHFFLRTLASGLVFGGIFFLLFQSTRFYIGLKAGGGILGFFLAGIQVWILAFCLLMQTYLLPFLFTKNWNLKKVIKWSAILVVMKPGFSVLMFLQALAMFVIITATGVGAALLALSLVSLFLNTTLREALRDMEAETSPKKKPTSWKEIFEDRQGREETRTLKDLFHPWNN